jgi:hypothetical protein
MKPRTSKQGFGLRAAVLTGLLVTSAAATGCISTAWKTRATLPHDTMTVLVARSNPPATVFIDGEDRGPTPLEFPLQYGKVTREKSRDVTLWMSDPKLASALTILTGGVYLPSSLFPVSSELRREDVGFSDNAFHIRIEAPGHAPFDTVLVLEGQPEERIEIDLEPSREAPDFRAAPPIEDVD